MDQFLFINIIITGLNLFIIVYAYSLSFFPVKWRKKVNQDTLVGLALIFFTMITMFAWIISQGILYNLLWAFVGWVIFVQYMYQRRDGHV